MLITENNVDEEAKSTDKIRKVEENEAQRKGGEETCIVDPVITGANSSETLWCIYESVLLLGLQFGSVSIQ